MDIREASSDLVMIVCELNSTDVNTVKHIKKVEMIDEIKFESVITEICTQK